MTISSICSATASNDGTLRARRVSVADLRRRLEPIDGDIRIFLLTLPAEENLRRIERRASTRALDELEFERRTVARERELLAASPPEELGEPFDVSAPPDQLVDRLLRRLGLR